MPSTEAHAAESARNTLSGGHHIKEDRARIRCRECGRIVRSTQSQKEGLCCICDMGSNANRVWARRMKVRDDELHALLALKLHRRDSGLVNFLCRPIRFNGLEAFLNRKIELKDIEAFLKRKVI